MFNINNGYRLIAVAAVTGALFSCQDNVNSQTTQFSQIQASLDAIQMQLAAMDARITAQEECTLEDFLYTVDGVTDENDVDNSCAGGKLPSDIEVSTTYCAGQDRAFDLGAQFAFEASAEIDAGAGWTSVAWGKAAGNFNIPLFIPNPPIPTPIPTEVSAGGGFSIGKGLEICVSLPMQPNTEQRAVIAQLIEGINIKDGLQAKYHRRANRLLNFAALRTPLAAPTLPVLGVSKPGLEYSVGRDDAFDIVDDAVERFMANGFQPNASAGGMFSDPIFADLASSLDLPVSLQSTIDDPQHLFEALQQVSVANACTTYGVDAQLRGRFPQVNNLCSTLESLPSEALVKAMPTYVNLVRTRVNSIWTGSQLRTFICDNVALGLFTSC